MALPAPQVVERLVTRFPDDVPQGDLNGRDRAHVNLRAFRIDVADQPLRNGLHLEWVHPEHQPLQLVDSGLNGFGEAVQRAFAHAVDVLVGRDLCEYPVLPGIAGYISINRGDSHAYVSSYIGASGMLALG